MHAHGGQRSILSIISSVSIQLAFRESSVGLEITKIARLRVAKSPNYTHVPTSMALSHNHVPPYPKQFFISEMDNLPDTRFFLTLPSQY